MTHRNFAAELQAAQETGDWDAHERIWEERRLAEVEADEAGIEPDHGEGEENAGHADGLDSGREELDPTAPRTITILGEFLDTALHELGKLVRKCQRYGNPDISVTVGQPYHHLVWKRDPFTGESKQVPSPDYVDVTIEGGAPRVGPFEFLAKVEHDPAGNILDIVPGRTVDPRFRSTPSSCEHCNKARSRKETYVLLNRRKGDPALPVHPQVIATGDRIEEQPSGGYSPRVEEGS